MGATDTQFCPTFRPSRAEFSRPFCDFVQDVCKQHPEIAMFKVVPPKGWSPRKPKYPPLDALRIQTPIKQHVSTELECVVLEVESSTRGILGDIPCADTGLWNRRSLQVLV